MLKIETCNVFKKSYAGFSLVEMLMALLVVSLLLAALAPVMTRRFGDNVNVSGINNKNTLMEPSGAKCFTEDTNDILLKDIGTINVVMVSGGGGGGSASSGFVKPVSPDAVQAGSDNATSVIPITKYMQNVKLIFMTGGGGGGGAGAAQLEGTTVKPGSDSCKEYGIGKTDTTGHKGTVTDRIVTYDGNGLCVTSYNQKGSSGCVTYTNGSFSTPTCNWTGTQEACADLKAEWGGVYDWRLPTIKEISMWDYSFVSNSITNGGLYLCSYNGDNTPKCQDSEYGAIQQRPYRIWSSTKLNTTDCYNNDGRSCYQFFGKNSWSPYSLCPIPKTTTAKQYGSVRCVLSDNISTEKFTSHSGGGGGASASISNNDVINEKINNAVKEVINSGSTGSIVLTAGKGGGGGSAPAEYNQTGESTNLSSGKNSCIAVLKGTSEIYKYCVLGGNAGSNASASSSGGNSGTGGGERILASGCSEYINGEKQSTPTAGCSAKGNAGVSGLSTEEETAKDGTGGISNLGGASSQGAGYNTTTGAGITLNDSINPGAGGGGGRALNKTTIGAGGRGSGGRVVITYEEYTPGSGGGGGAGGNLALINNWFIGNDENSVCDVTVGNGGSGGAAVGSNSSNGTAGNNGKASSIICHRDNTKYTITGGLGGGGGLNEGSAANSSNPNAKLGGQNDSSVKVAISGVHNTNTKLSVTVGGNGSPAGENDKKGFGGDGGNALGLISSGILQGGTLSNINGTGYLGSLPNVSVATYETLRAGSYPTGARGGGGGAFKDTSTRGKGGDGEPGYVCIYWINE